MCQTTNNKVVVRSFSAREHMPFERAKQAAEWRTTRRYVAGIRQYSVMKH